MKHDLNFGFWHSNLNQKTSTHNFKEMEEERSNDSMVLCHQKTYGHHGVLVPRPVLTPKVKKPKFECPTCRKPYAEGSLISHQCKKHLFYFKLFKKPGSDRYTYRCRKVGCDMVFRLG